MRRGREVGEVVEGEKRGRRRRGGCLGLARSRLREAGGEGAAMRWGRTGRGEREGGAAGGPA
jgi:hypothetical protein